jgi:hypothetical protein
MRFLVPPFFETDEIYSILEIENWFNESWQKYNWIADWWRCKYCSFRRRKLPCICSEPDEQWQFLKLYEAIDAVLRMHRKEAYFKEELIEFYNCKDAIIDLKIWTAKNEKLGIVDCSRFIIKFLGSNTENSKKDALRFFGNSPIELSTINHVRKELGRGGDKTKLDYEVFIYRKHFKYMLEFITVFEEVFWKQEILPESLERIAREL